MKYLLLVGMAVLIGCSTSIHQMEVATDVKGKVTRAGKPVGDILLTLQPLGDGHVAPLTVGGDGSFHGDVVPGKYAYYIGKSASKASEQALKKIDPKFQEGNMDRTVVVESGKDLVIALD